MQLRRLSKYSLAFLQRVALATTLTLLVSLEVNAQSTQTLTEIEQLYASGNYNQALNLVDAQMKNYVGDSNLHYLRANILDAREKYPRLLLNTRPPSNFHQVPPFAIIATER